MSKAQKPFCGNAMDREKTGHSRIHPIYAARHHTQWPGNVTNTFPCLLALTATEGVNSPNELPGVFSFLGSTPLFGSGPR